MTFKRYVASAALAAATLGFGPAAHAIPVATELALLVDVSGSVNSSEYTLQKAGYINAFRDAALHTNIASLTGGIAVTYIEWSGRNQQSQLVNWFHITDATSANAFADLIQSSLRAYDGGSTAVGNAISYVTPQFAVNGFESLRQVIDVSGDGADNDSDIATTVARDLALAEGVDAINGLPILGETGLEDWYKDNVQGGPDGFVLPAQSFDDFDAIVKAKIGEEINDVPEPASLALLLAGFAGMGLLRRKSK